MPVDELDKLLDTLPKQQQRDPLDDLLDSMPKPAAPTRSIPEPMSNWVKEQAAAKKPAPIPPDPLKPPPSTIHVATDVPLPPTPKTNAVGVAPPPIPGEIPGMERLGGGAPGVPRPQPIRPSPTPRVMGDGLENLLPNSEEYVIADDPVVPALVRGVSSAVSGTVGGISSAIGEADFNKNYPSKGNIGTARGFGQSPGMDPVPVAPEVPRTPDNLPQRALRSVGQSASALDADVQKTFARDASIKNFIDDPAGAMSDPRWWLDATFNAAGSMAPMVATGVGSAAAIGRVAASRLIAPEVAAAAAKYGPSVAAGLTESAQAYGSTYEEARKAGVDPETARLASSVVAAGTGLTAIPAHKVGIFSDQIRSIGKRIAAGMAAEGAQEGAQTWWENAVARTFYDPNRPLMQGVPEAMVGAALVGGAVGTATGASEAAQAPIADPLDQLLDTLPKTEVESVRPTPDPLDTLLDTLPQRDVPAVIPPAAEAPVSAPLPPNSEEILPSSRPAEVTTPVATGINELPPDTSLFPTSNEGIKPELAPAQASIPLADRPIELPPGPREEVVQQPVEAAAPVSGITYSAIDSVSPSGKPKKTILTKNTEGVAFGEISLIDDGEGYRVDYTSVDKPYRGQGLGKALYQEAIRAAKQYGKKYIESAHSVSESAANVWKSLGAEEISGGRYRVNFDSHPIPPQEINAPLPPETPPQATPVDITPQDPGAPGGTWQDKGKLRIRTQDVQVDPIRFQYKVENIGQGGVTSELKDVQGWDDDAAGTIFVWKDPANGQTYVVNGHHRYDLARRLGVPDIGVKYLNAATAKEARIQGALQNIREGKGTAVDAAKFMRDTGLSVEDLAKERISIKGAVAKDGAALANLAPSLFDDVVHGNLKQDRAVIIGEGLNNFEDQKAVLKLAEQKRATNNEIREMIRLANGTQSTSEAPVQSGLFGDIVDDAPSLIYETSQLSNFIRQRISQEKKLFGLVGNQSAAERLGTAGNEIKADANREISDQANQALAVYDKLSARSGPIAELLRHGAERIARGERPESVKQDIYAAVRDSVAKLVGPKEAPARDADVRPGIEGRDQPRAAGVQENPRVGTVEQTPSGAQETLVTDIEARESQLAAKRDRTTPLAEVPFSLIQEEAPKPTGPDERQTSMFEEESGPIAYQKRKPGTPSKKAAAQPRQTGTMVSRQEIVDDLSEYLNGLPIRTGGFREKALGIFKVKQAVVRTKKPLDMETIAHEVGHAIHKFIWGVTAKGNLNNKRLNPFRRELGPLDYDPKQSRVFEGFAEYVRLYMTNPAEAQRRAPAFDAWFNSKLQTMPELQAVMQKAQERFLGWEAQPATAKIAASIKAKVREPKKWVSHIDQVIADVFDDRNAILKAEKEFAAAGAPVEAARGAHSLMQRLTASSSKAQRMIEKGTFSGDPGTKYRDVGKSFLSILEPLGDRKSSEYNPKWEALKKDWGVKVVGDGLDDLRVYVFARRMQDYLDQGLETGFKKAEIQEAIKATETPAVKKAAEEWHQFNDEVLQYAVDKKALTPAQAAKIRDKNLFYVRLDRVMDGGGESKTPSTVHKLFDGGSPIMRRKGSSREVEDPISSAIRNVYGLVKWADGQEAVQALVDQAFRAESKGSILETGIQRAPKATQFNLREVEDKIKKILVSEGIDIKGLSKDAFDAMSAIYRPDVTGNRKRGEVVVNIDGKPEIVYMDAALLEALESMPPGQRNILLKVGKAQADLLRLGATTLGPEFTIRNFFNDQITAAIQSEHGYIPIISGIQGAMSKLFDKGLQDTIVKSGGQGSSFTPKGLESAQQFVEAAMANTSPTKKIRYAMRHPLELFNVLIDLAKTPGEFLEGATRTGEARLAQKRGKTPDQIAEAYRRVSLDFGVQGKGVRKINPYFAYLGAKLNGTRRFQQAHTRKNFPRTFLKAFSYVTLPTIALWMLNKDDEEYWALEPWKRNVFWMFPTKYLGKRARDIFGPFIPIPRANLYGLVYGNMVERGMDKAYRKNPDAFKGAAWESFNDVVPVSNALPTVGTVPLELLMGRKLYNLAPIESAEDQKHSEQYRARPNTSELARVLGRKTGWSPLKIDHAIFGMSAGLGRAVVNNMVDPALTAVDQATGATMGTRKNRPTKQFSDRTFLRALSTPDSPQTPEPVTKFYDELNTLQQAKKDAADAVKFPNGPTKGAKRLNSDETRKLKRLEEFSKRMSAKRTEIKKIDDNEAGDPDVRAEDIKRLRRDIINLAQEALYKPHIYK